MPAIECPVNNCQFATAEDCTVELAVELLKLHAVDHRQPTAQTVAATNGPKLERPKVARGLNEEQWNMFERRWGFYKPGSGITATNAASQLFQCASEDLGDYMLKVDPNIASKTEAEVTKLMKQLAIVPVADVVTRAELIKMEQSRDEKFRGFAARVQGKAETCNYKTTCECGKTPSYTDKMVIDVITAGIVDLDIRK